MANRYWVGGTGSWTLVNTANWSTTSGGAGGASVPTADDDVFFDQSATYTVTIGAANATIPCKSFTHSAGNVTFAGSAINVTLEISGSFYLSSTAIVTYSRTILFVSNGSETITTNGVTIPGFTIDPSTYGTFSLGSALTTSVMRMAGDCTINTNNYALTATSSIQISATIILNLGSSSVTCSSISSTSNFTLNPGTSTLNIDNAIELRSVSNVEFYNINVVASTSPCTIGSTNTDPNATFTCNNLTINQLASPGNRLITFYYNNINVNQTLSVIASTNASYRVFLSGYYPDKRTTLTCNAVSSLQDVDFRYIIFAGNCISGGDISGTRLGNAGYNSNILFAAPKTVYWNLATGGNWYTANGWTDTSGGTPDPQFFPLAQDTAVFQTTGLNSGATVTVGIATGVVGTIDTSDRTAATMTLTLGINFYICKDVISGTGCTWSGGINLYSSQDAFITSAGRSLGTVVINSYPYKVTLNDSLTTTSIRIDTGRLNTADYSVTLSSSILSLLLVRAEKTLDIGNSTVVLTGSGALINIGNNFSNSYQSYQAQVLGTGTFNLTSASAKNITVNGAYLPVINQGGTGALTINGSGTFGNITNTALGNVLFNPLGLFTFNNFSLNGTGPAQLLTVTTSSVGNPARLRKSGTWFMGANSLDGGNNTNLVFTAGGGCDYLSVSYINGELYAPGNALGMIGL